MTSLRLAFSAALAAVLLLGFAAPPTAGAELAVPGAELPPCPAGASGSTTAPLSHRPSAHPPWLPGDDPAACRARATRVEPAATTGPPVPRPGGGGGYDHLGATTVDEWAGLLGRITVRDPAVRRDSYDFVATRFMAKRGAESGAVAWLEVGWAETGWSGRGAQRIYTFDSAAMSWVFFDDYRIGDGDQLWIYLHGGRASWRAWLWWGDRWQLLAAPEVSLGGGARLEQYVEVHRDGRGPAIAVPPIQVDNVWVRADPDAPLQRWRAERVPTVAELVVSGYCLDWQTRYDTWSAGDCPAIPRE